MRVEEKLQIVLDLQAQGVSREEITKQVGAASVKALGSFMGDRGYRSDRRTLMYVPKDSNVSAKENQKSNNTPTNIDSNTSTKKNQNLSNTKSITPVNTESITPQPNTYQVLDPIQEELVKTLTDEKETIQDMIQWFKKYRVLVASDILVELPVSENTMISCRSNKTMWEQFGAFADTNKAFSKGDLLAQALKEFVEKYNK
ncbi:MAG: hypothetical protein RR490_03405 [Niameybacter sp.]